MLIGNYSVLNKNPGRAFGGSTVSDSRGQLGKSGAVRGRYFGDAGLGFIKTEGTPRGYYPPYSWVITPKAGGIASNTIIVGQGTLSNGNLAGGKNGTADLSGSGSVSNALLTLIFWISSGLVGVGSSTSSITGKVEITSSISGDSSVSGALGALTDVLAALSCNGSLTGYILGKLGASSSLSGNGNIIDADLDVIGVLLSDLAGVGNLSSGITGKKEMVSAVVGSGVVTNCDLKALAYLLSDLSGSTIVAAGIDSQGWITADITPYTDLSPENLARAVWEALSVDYNTPGTMGNKLNSAASAGDPWATALPGSYIDGTAGYIIAIIAKVLRNKMTTNPVTGKITVYDDDDVSILLEGDLYEDVAGLQPYQGQGADRRDRMT